MLTLLRLGVTLVIIQSLSEKKLNDNVEDVEKVWKAITIQISPENFKKLNDKS